MIKIINRIAALVLYVSFRGNCQSTLCLFVLCYCIILLSAVANNHLEQINHDDDDDIL